MNKTRKVRAESKLPKPLNAKLNGYVLAAGASGAAVLAGSLPADARIVHEKIGSPLGGIYYFNPAQQVVPAFVMFQTFIWSGTGFWNRAGFYPLSNGASALLAATGLPAELVSGSLIGSERNFGKGTFLGTLFTYGPYGGGTLNHHRGNFGKPGFVGFRFKVDGRQLYGWLRLSFSLGKGPGGTKKVKTNLIDYAFETIPDKPIRAGQIKDEDEPSPSAGQSALDDGGSVVNLTSNKLQAPSLGALALGAGGIPIWRQK